MGEQRTISVSRAAAPVSPLYESHFEKHAAAAARYERDDGDLLPQPKKTMPTGHVPVELADAVVPEVQQCTKTPTVFHATAKPKIFFSGNITVTDVPEEVDVEEEAAPAAQSAVHISRQSPDIDAKEHLPSQIEPAATPPAQAVPIVTVVGKRNRHIDINVLSEAEAMIHHATPASAPLPEVRRLAVSVEDDEKTVPLEPTATRLRNPHGVVGMQRQRISDRNPHGGTLRIDTVAPAPLTRGPVLGGSAIPIVCAVVVGLVVAWVMIGFQLEIDVTTGEVVEDYTYRLDALGASVPFTSSR